MWKGWLKVGEIAKYASCPRSLKNLIDCFSVDKEIDLDRKSPDEYEEKEYTKEQLFGKVAEEIIQHTMTRSSPEEIIFTGQNIINWLTDLLVNNIIMNGSKYVNFNGIEFPWTNKPKAWVNLIKWNEGDFNEMINLCENWNRESCALEFQHLHWVAERSIRVNYKLPNGNYLPISGRIDLSSQSDNSTYIVEIKTTRSDNRDSAYLQAETYAEMESFMQKPDIKSYIFHDKNIKSGEDSRIRLLIKNANPEDTNPSFSNCRYCNHKPECDEAKLS